MNYNNYLLALSHAEAQLQGPEYPPSMRRVIRREFARIRLWGERQVDVQCEGRKN